VNLEICHSSERVLLMLKIKTLKNLIKPVDPDFDFNSANILLSICKDYILDMF
jgi:hypothetical protein